MKTYYISDENYVNSTAYQDFLKQNPTTGSLIVRAFAASQAIPISGLKVVVSTTIGNDTVIFFDGYTNESGTTEKISLPTPRLDLNNLNIPLKQTYDIRTTYEPDNIIKNYQVDMYEGIFVLQTINIVPENLLGMGGM